VVPNSTSTAFQCVVPSRSSPLLMSTRSAEKSASAPWKRLSRGERLHASPTSARHSRTSRSLLEMTSWTPMDMNFVFKAFQSPLFLKVSRRAVQKLVAASQYWSHAARNFQSSIIGSSPHCFLSPKFTGAGGRSSLRTCSAVMPRPCRSKCD